MRIVAISLILFCSFSAFCQSNLAIELSKKESKRKIIIKEGKKVSYILKSGAGRGKGRITSITNEAILINGREFHVNDIGTIRKANSGRFFGIFFMSVGAVFTFASLMPTDGAECLDCDEVDDGDNSAVILGLGLGVASAGIGFAILESTFPRKIDSGDWTAKIIELK